MNTEHLHPKESECDFFFATLFVRVPTAVSQAFLFIGLHFQFTQNKRFLCWRGTTNIELFKRGASAKQNKYRFHRSACPVHVMMLPGFSRHMCAAHRGVGVGCYTFFMFIGASSATSAAGLVLDTYTSDDALKVKP